MIYLKEFATQAEYDAFVQSGEMKRPNVSYINETSELQYRKALVNGIFIQHLDGSLLSKEEWLAGGYSNESANGVAVITSDAQFVIAKTHIGFEPWSSNTNTLIDGILTTKNANEAVLDYSGAKNTKLMLTTDTSEAAFVCSNYVFPDGSKGYLPALGEIYTVFKNLYIINELLTTIGAYKLNTQNTFWSSTQYSESLAWCYDFNGSGYFRSNSKNSTSLVRPFTSLR